MFFKIDHIGWTTGDVGKFEEFWCGGLGFEMVEEKDADLEMIRHIFGVHGPAKVRKYSRKGTSLKLEIHYFPSDCIYVSKPAFQAVGTVHVCLVVDNREEILAQLPEGTIISSYDNPKGWTSVFLRDLEGNWIELREVI